VNEQEETATKKYLRKNYNKKMQHFPFALRKGINVEGSYYRVKKEVEPCNRDGGGLGELRYDRLDILSHIGKDG
jgi:hypothetical protein